MVEKIGIEKFYKKNVVVKFVDENNEISVTTGILTDYEEDDYDEEEEERIWNGFIVVQTETDYDRIPLNKLTKIYLKN